MSTIKEENGLYTINDSTSGGYVDRMTYNYMQRWESVWDKDCKFISLRSSIEDLTKVILEKDKTHYDYHKAVRAKARHLRLLQEHLGIDVKAPPKKERVVEEIIYRGKSAFESMDKLKVMKATIHPSTISDGMSSYKKHTIHYTELTYEKQMLMDEYNANLEAFKKFQNEMFRLIFEE